MENQQTPQNHPANGKPEAYYLNEQGLVVLTEWFLLKRGYCCGNGCRHCPFQYEAVSEPNRSYLLAAKKNRPH